MILYIFEQRRVKQLNIEKAVNAANEFCIDIIVHFDDISEQVVMFSSKKKINPVQKVLKSFK